jgi:hypothetical protein
MSRINEALRTLGLPPLIVEDPEHPEEPMTKVQAQLYVIGFFGVYLVGGLAALGMIGHR